MQAHMQETFKETTQRLFIIGGSFTKVITSD